MLEMGECQSAHAVSKRIKSIATIATMGIVFSRDATSPPGFGLMPAPDLDRRPHDPR
jgi:hypothetical protein